MNLLPRLQRLFRRANLDDDIQEELQTHIDMRTADNIANGMSPDAARRDASLKFGNLIAMKERVVGVDAALGLDSFFRDIKFALRQLRKSPGFALTAILTLALGIGVATAMFAIVDGILLRPLAFPQANHLYVPAAVGEKGDQNDWISYADLQTWQKGTQASAQIAFSGGTIDIAETHAGAMLISNDTLSSNFLKTLGVQPMLGRDFFPEEQLEGRSNVVLLSDGVWKNAFAGNPKVLGQILRIGGVPFTVIGVMPPKFAMPLESGASSEVFTPIEHTMLLTPDATFKPILRLRPDATRAGLEAELSSVQAHIAQIAKPGEQVATHVQLTGLRESMVANVRPALIALDFAVALVWLIACCNVAGLLLARLSARGVEIAVRGALGAGKLRIFRQLLIESLLLSSAGAVIGVGLATFILRIFSQAMERYSPQAQNISLDATVVVTVVGFSVLTGLLSGVFPSIFAASAPLADMLKSGGPNSSGNHAQESLRNALLMGEIAISIVLLVGAGLMLRTVYSLRHVPLGFRTDHLVLANFTVPNWHYKDRNLNAVLWAPLLENVRRLPGVEAAALSSVLPIGHDKEITIQLYQNLTGRNITAVVRAASPGLGSVLGMRMHAGRFFTTQDRLGAAPVMVVNQAFVRDYLGGRPALGKLIRLGDSFGQPTIVGVLDDIRQDDIASTSSPEIYLSMAQLPPGSSLSLALTGRFMELAVRTQAKPVVMIPELRGAIHRENPDLVAEDFSTMEQAIDDAIGSQRLAARVIGTFGALALLITAVGLYGLLSYSVAQRTREIGIRIALGADRGRVIRLILRQAFVLLAAGVAAGIALAFCATRFLSSFLYGVSTHDPWTLVVVPIVLMLSSALAAFIPARRAASTDPIRALRSE